MARGRMQKGRQRRQNFIDVYDTPGCCCFDVSSYIFPIPVENTLGSRLTYTSSCHALDARGYTRIIVSRRCAITEAIIGAIIRKTKKSRRVNVVVTLNHSSHVTSCFRNRGVLCFTTAFVSRALQGLSHADPFLPFAAGQIFSFLFSSR